MVGPNDNATGATMPDELKMTVDERRKVLMIMQEEYLQAERKRRSELLDQAEQLTGQHRKSLIRLLLIKT